MHYTYFGSHWYIQWISIVCFRVVFLLFISFQFCDDANSFGPGIYSFFVRVWVFFLHAIRGKLNGFALDVACVYVCVWVWKMGLNVDRFVQKSQSNSIILCWRSMHDWIFVEFDSLSVSTRINWSNSIRGQNFCVSHRIVLNWHNYNTIEIQNYINFQRKFQMHFIFIFNLVIVYLFVYLTVL